MLEQDPWRTASPPALASPLRLLMKWTAERRIVILALVMSLLSPAAISQERRPDDFVDASELVPGLVLEMRYAGSHNFIGRPVAGYEAPICLLTREAAAALGSVQQELGRFGLGLKVFDCFRPQTAVDDFVRWAADPADQAHRAEYYPRVDKSELFALGYIAARSGHSRGSTVDLTLVDLATREELDMGGGFDLFDTRSWPAEPGISAGQRAHRLLLQSVMGAHGFRPYEREWWHFTLNDEPYPETYFDFPIARR